MKSVILTERGKISLKKFPRPKIKKENEVLIKPQMVGLCGTDYHYFLTGSLDGHPLPFPVILGHECAAVVEEAGPKVRKVKPGDHVVIDPALSCKRCDQCQRGRPHTCRNLKFMGFPGQTDGCFSQYVVLPEENCYGIEKNMPLTRAALVEPLSIGLYAVELMKKVKNIPVKSAGILGSGPIGLSVFLALKAEGVGSVFMTDKIDERLKSAQEAGATWVGNPDKSDLVKEIKRKEPLNLDVVFECCGDPQALEQAVELLKPGGILMILGIPLMKQVSFPIHILRRKEICIQNVRRQNHCIPEAVRMLQSGQIQVDFMATHVFPYSKAQQAFEVAANYRDGVLKAMVQFD